MPKHLLFLDCTGQHTEFQFPQDIPAEESVVSASLVRWNVEGLAEATGDYTDSGFYIQAQFSGLMNIRSLAGGARSDMLQIPVRSFNGWPPTTSNIPVHLERHASHNRLIVDLFAEGDAPLRLAPAAGATLRVLLWFEINTSK